MPENFFIKTIHTYYHEKDPVFFNTNDYLWTKKLRDNTDKIIEVLAPILSDDYVGLADNPETTIQLKPRLWKGYQFYFNGFKIKKNLAPYPFIEKLLSEIPYLISAQISVLKPGAQILPHTGNTNGIMRYHLGLKIPAFYPECGMTVDRYNVSWQKGHDMMFCDMKIHSVQNLSNKSRYILLIDVIRPEFYVIANLICVHSTARILTNIVATHVKKIISFFKIETHRSSNNNIISEASKSARFYNETSIHHKNRSIVSILEKVTLKIFISLLYVIFYFNKSDTFK